MSDLISREAAIAAITNEKFIIRPQLNSLYDGLGFMSKRADFNAVCDIVIGILEKLPSAQQWIPLDRRPMTEEERKEYSEKLGYDVEYADPCIYGNLPEDGQKVIITTRCLESVVVDRFFEFGYISGFDNYEKANVIAWMPLPEPYKGGAE